PGRERSEAHGDHRLRVARGRQRALPCFDVAPRPGRQGGRAPSPSSRSSVAPVVPTEPGGGSGGGAGRGLPTLGAVRRGRSRRRRSTPTSGSRGGRLTRPSSHRRTPGRMWPRAGDRHGGLGYSSAMLPFVDLDGVVYRGAEPVPGVAAVLADRAARGDAIVYVTNNSMHYRADYVARLAGMGCPVNADRVVSSSRATALYLREHHPKVHRVLTVGAAGLERELRDVGLDVVPAADAAERSARDDVDGFEAAGRPQAVVVGVDPGIDYGRLA